MSIAMMLTQCVLVEIDSRRSKFPLHKSKGIPKPEVLDLKRLSK